jgi:hypothetical protein
MQFGTFLLRGAVRSGKTTFCKETFRIGKDSRTLYLPGAVVAPTIYQWLLRHIPTLSPTNSWGKLEEAIIDTYYQQPFRILAHQLWKDKLSRRFLPQPITIVVDDADKLLKVYGMDMLYSFAPLVRLSAHSATLRLIFVASADTTAESLQLYNRSYIQLYTRTLQPIPREEIVQKYGHRMAHWYDVCGENIGLTMEYSLKYGSNLKVDVREFAQNRLESLLQERSISKAITWEEYAAYLEKKKNFDTFVERCLIR